MSTTTPIFILSMPRSGSTLLQRILASHPDITTVGEPHFLLPLLYALRKDGVYAEYDHVFTVGAIHDFLTHLPEGEAAYRRAVATMAQDLYATAATRGERFFVDKAPRYALIAEDLLATFPDAPFIVLWRNPLAVAASLMETYRGGGWNLYKADDHLYRGLPNLVRIATDHPDRLHFIRYEDLVIDPVATTAALTRGLGLDPTDLDVAGAASRRIRGTVGDKMGQRKYTTISSSGVDAWTTTFNNTMRRRWAEGYLDWIGADRLRTMGYDADTLLASLHARPPSSDRLLADVVFMAYGTVHRKLDPPVWRAKTQDSLWRYIQSVAESSRALRRRALRNRKREPRSARPASTKGNGTDAG